MVHTILFGTGGYGAQYLNQLTQGDERTKLVAAVDPYPLPETLQLLKAQSIPCYATPEEALDRHKAELVVISSPIAFHLPQTLLALSHGCHVLCEKPLAPTMREVEEIARARDEADRIVAVGFQWSYAEAMLSLKKDILAGVYGRALDMKSRVLWPRDAAYYKRGGGWAGKIKDTQGRLILDSVASNATAHYLFNMLFLLGDTLPEAASLTRARAGLYRANPIETFDTIFFEGQAADTAIRFYASHAVPKNFHPAFEYTFENGIVRYDAADRTGEARLVGQIGNRTIDYGDPYEQEMRKLWVMVDAVMGKGEPTCSVEAAGQHTLAISAAHSSMSPQNFPQSWIHSGEVTWVEGLETVLLRCYEQKRMPSEQDVPGDTELRFGKWVDIAEARLYNGE